MGTLSTTGAGFFRLDLEAVLLFLPDDFFALDFLLDDFLLDAFLLEDFLLDVLLVFLLEDFLLLLAASATGAGMVPTATNRETLKINSRTQRLRLGRAAEGGRDVEVRKRIPNVLLRHRGRCNG
ncbi:MAG: hypothetical protein ACKO6N_29275 [Myxococcota bacterium]